MKKIILSLLVLIPSIASADIVAGPSSDSTGMITSAAGIVVVVVAIVLAVKYFKK